MLSGGKRRKTTIGLISKKATLHVQHTFFVHFFAVVLHYYNVKLPETFSWRKCRTCSRSLCFSLPLIFFLHWWPLALSPLLQNFHVILPTKKYLLCFFFSLFFFYLQLQISVALFLVEFRWPATFSLSFSCSIFQICGHDN